MALSWGAGEGRLGLHHGTHKEHAPRTHLLRHTLEQTPSEPAQKIGREHGTRPSGRAHVSYSGALAHLAGHPQSGQEVAFQPLLHLEQFGLLARKAGGGGHRKG